MDGAKIFRILFGLNLFLLAAALFLMVADASEARVYISPLEWLVVFAAIAVPLLAGYFLIKRYSYLAIVVLFASGALGLFVLVVVINFIIQVLWLGGSFP